MIDTDTEVAPPAGCRSCGSPAAPSWDTPDGRVALCHACAALHGVGCP